MNKDFVKMYFYKNKINLESYIEFWELSGEKYY